MLNIWGLSDDIKKYSWFTELRDYVELRYEAIVNRFKKTFDYVTPHKENSETYSFEYASILRDTGSVFDTTCNRIIKKAYPNYETKIKGMLEFLHKYEPQLEYIRLRFLHYGGFLYPFKPENNGVPEWWTAYNKIKHEEIESMHQGNFKNTVIGLSALGIIKQSVVQNHDLGIFTVIDYPFSEIQKTYYTDFFDYIQFYSK